MYLADKEVTARLRAEWNIDPEENTIFRDLSAAQKERALANALRLWEGDAPGACGDHWRDVPMLYPLLPDAGRATGAAIIVCPGGGYMFHAPYEGIPVGEWLNTLGIAAFVLQYRLIPYVQPAALRDAQRAIRLVRARAASYGVDPARVGIMGFSAGGHLSAAAATLFDDGDLTGDAIARQSARPDAAILIYPLTDLRDNPWLQTLVLGRENAAETHIVRYSPMLHVTERTPPTFLWHNLTDELVPYQQSLGFAQALAKHGVPFELHLWGSGRHGSGVAYDDARYTVWPEVVAGWLQIQGFC